MIRHYFDYIERYVRRSADQPPLPGEHHFVAAYLVPRLVEIDRIVPDYINPDGTKDICGDVVYYRDAQHHFGIEVKLGSVRLTKREFNDWVVNTKPQRWPNLFVGVGATGIAICTWAVFRSSYIASIQKLDPNWVPLDLATGYGPMKRVDKLSEHLPEAVWFPAEKVRAEEHERRFMSALRGYRRAA